jgi:hypothetical protein
MLKKYFLVTTIILMTVIVLGVISTEASLIKKTPVEKVNVNVDALLDSFISSYQAKDVEKLVNLYASTAKSESRSYSRPAIKQQYLQIFGKQKDVTISGIIIIGGKDSFQLVDANKAVGTINLRITFRKGGQTKSVDTNLNWTIGKPEGGGEWQVLETGKLAIMDDAPAEGH